MRSSCPHDRFFSATCWVVIASSMIAGCATNKETGPKDAAAEGDSKTDAPGRAGGYPPLTVNGADYRTLGELVRALGESTKTGGVVLVAGLEERPMPPLNVTHGAFGDGLARLVAPADCLVRDGGAYQFVYPPGYEALLNVSTGPEVHPRYRELRASYAVGAGTDMYNALALLSETVKATIIADNTIADVWCGELYVHEAPVATIVEALLRSARIVPGAFAIESTEEYIFVRSAANSTAVDTCLNRDTLAPHQIAMLDRQVDVRLPAHDGTLRFGDGAVPLQSILPELSRQLGFTVSIAPNMADFPINRATFLGLSASDVLNLIVRQWPVAQFGYTVDSGGVRLLPTS